MFASAQRPVAGLLPQITKRPVVGPEDMANAVVRALDWKRQEERVCQAYCRGSVEYLSWSNIWPRWRSWFAKGLEEAY